MQNILFAVVKRQGDFPDSLLPVLVNFCHIMVCRETPKSRADHEQFRIFLKTEFKYDVLGEVLGYRFDYTIIGEEEAIGMIIFKPMPADTVIKVNTVAVEISSEDFAHFRNHSNN